MCHQGFTRSPYRYGLHRNRDYPFYAKVTAFRRVFADVEVEASDMLALKSCYPPAGIHSMRR